jgi:AAA+ superfamily predicted ATPase
MRPPLIVLAGDVGSGKTELASTIGDAVARQEKINVTMLPLSLSTRGQGRVGQMTQLVSAAFEYTFEKAKKFQSETGKTRGAVILLVDEADALAQSRENNQMHHEDKAGVNAFIRGIDSLGNGKLPAAVIMCTNRPNALDPAIKRRAAEIFYFKRPNETQRFSVLEAPLTELGFTGAEIKKIADITGPREGMEYGFTFSDLIQRLLPSIILDAYPTQAVSFAKAKEIAAGMYPTSIFKEN